MQIVNLSCFHKMRFQIAFFNIHYFIIFFTINMQKKIKISRNFCNVCTIKKLDIKRYKSAIILCLKNKLS